jgi:hypothetical protein
MDNVDRYNSVRFQDVEFNDQGITLFSQQSRLLSIDKKEIRKVILKYGFQSERPAVEIIFGIVVIGLGFYFFIHFLLNIWVNRVVYLDDMLSLLLLPVGGWFIVDGFRKRFYFEVELDHDRRKFPLGKSPDMDKLKKFVSLASQLGYSIDSSFADYSK